MRPKADITGGNNVNNGKNNIVYEETSQPDSNFFNAVDRRETSTIGKSAQLPELDDTDALQLYHLRSFPHLLVTSQVGSFNIQNSALAFRSTRTLDVVVFLFEPQNYSACFLPIISPNSTLEWDTRAVVTVLRELDISYWQQSTFLAHVNGVVYANYIQWVSKYLETNSRFILHSICSSADELSCFVHSHTWDNFVADSMTALAKLAVKMRAILPPRATKIEIISFVEPITISPIISNNSSQRKEIKKASEGIISAQSQSAESVEENSHIRSTVGYVGTNIRRLFGFLRGSSHIDRIEEVSRRSIPEDGGNGEQQAGENLDDVEYGEGEGDKLPPDVIEIPKESTSDPSNGNGNSPAPPPFSDIVPVDSPGSTPIVDAAATTTSNSNTSNSNSDSSSNHTSVAGVSNATPLHQNSSNTTSSGTSEWLAELPPPNIFDPTVHQRKQNITDIDVIQFYLNLMTCMQEYQLESYSSAFRSCLKEEDVAFVHKYSDQYYQISPRYPFIVDNHYFQTIPDAQYQDFEQTTQMDVVIGSTVAIFFVLGFFAALVQLKLFEWCREKQKKLMNNVDKSRGQGDSIGLRVWHQHNWRNSPSPSNSLSDLLSLHYGHRKSGSIHSLNSETEGDQVESSPLLGAETATATAPAGPPRAAPIRPSFSSSSSLSSTQQHRRNSWEVGIVDEGSPTRTGQQGILARSIRSDNDMSAMHISIINFKKAPEDGDVDDDQLNSSDNVDFEDSVIDRGVAFTVLGLNQGSKSFFFQGGVANGAINGNSSGSLNGTAGTAVNSFHSQLIKGSPMPLPFNSNGSGRDDNTIATIERLIESSHDEDPVALGDLDVGKSRRRSAAGAASEVLDLL